MAVVGWIAVHALFALAGGAILAALGLLRPTRRGVLAALGPAYVTGVAAVVLVLIALMVIGVPFTGLTLLVVALLLAAGCGALARRRGGVDRHLPAPLPAASRLELWGVRLLGAVVVVFLLLGGTAFTDLPTNWDPAHMWQLRAGMIYHWHGLVGDVFTNVGLFAPFHMDYPVFQPTFEAGIFHGLGHEDVQYIHVELWGLFAAAVWTGGYLLAPGRRAIAWLPAIAALAVANGFTDGPLQGNADLTLAIYIGLGALAIGLWLERGRFEHVALGALFLAAAGNTKKEGLVFAAVVALAALAVVVARRQWRELRPLGIALVGLAALVIPWLAYVHFNHLPSGDTVPVRTMLSLDYLSDRFDRLRIAQHGVLEQLTRTGDWVLAAPLLLALGTVCFVTRTLRRVAAFYLAAGALMVAALLWIYWTGTWPDINMYLNLTVNRTVMSIVALCALGSAQLAAAFATRERAGPE